MLSIEHTTCKVTIFFVNIKGFLWIFFLNEELGMGNGEYVLKRK